MAAATNIGWDGVGVGAFAALVEAVGRRHDGADELRCWAGLEYIHATAGGGYNIRTVEHERGLNGGSRPTVK